ncbi:MAG: McrBC 5-methylcytosine restriction system component [Candidatus Velthaea sp.]
MNRTIELVESRPTEVAITKAEAQSITALGKALASKSTWWGGEADEALKQDRSVISCTATPRNTWIVTVSNAIGAFGVDELTCLVTPKIPMSHVLYILLMSPLMPRMDESRARLGAGEALWELLARWFLGQAEQVVASDLLRDYQTSYGLLSSLRGQLDSMATANTYYSGSLAMVCTYDDFTVDNALNRVLLAGLRALERLSRLRIDLRRSSRRLASHFLEVGQLQNSDLTVATDRRSAHYGDALKLAKLIIEGTTFDVSAGSSEAWTFMIRTPEAIESGIRAVLAAGLSPRFSVRKYGTTLRPGTMQVQPDLRFDPTGYVGDVKYKNFGSDWPRGDLYQSVAFAAGCGVQRSCVISMDVGNGARLPNVTFGDIEVSSILWDSREETKPSDAASRLIADCNAWLERPMPRAHFHTTQGHDCLYLPS